MKNGRTVHSLIKTLSKYKGNRFIMISTPQLQMPEYVIEVLKESGCDYSFSDSLEKSIADLDVLYMTRIQQERFASREEYEAQKGVYVLDEQKMKLAKPDLVVLHPCPVWMKSPSAWTTTRAQNTLHRRNTVCMPAWR